MAPLVYVMAILGCGDDGATCNRERIEPATYVSASACQAAMPAALGRHTDLSYPVITAACQRKGEQIAEQPRPNARRAG